jgi:ribose transport system ATP-binding protein
MPEHEILSVSGIGKTYNEPVLADIQLRLYPGRVLALTGENGAGKSTFSKIVGGLIAPTAGEMTYLGKPYAPQSRTEAENLGVRMVMQELNLVPTLSIAENLFLNKLPHRAGWILHKPLAKMANEAMAQVGLSGLDPSMPVGELGIGHQQMIEIARNLIGESRILILDEPTAMLTSREVELLFTQIRRFKEQGVALIYISHRLEELAEIADDVAVLRDGKLVCHDKMNRYTSNQLVTLMVGRELEERAAQESRSTGEVILKVEHLGRGKVVQDISFELHRGEILGICGLVGAGRTELLRLIYGADLADQGDIWVGSPLAKTVIGSPQVAVQKGIALVTEDRKGEGLLLPQPIATNIALGNMDKVTHWGVIDRQGEYDLASNQMSALSIRSSGPAQRVAELSGGNQQKVLISRWLERNCEVVLFDEPTRGIDVGAKFDIYALLNKLADQGKGLVMVSSDLRELMQICDRIAVLSAGRLIDIFGREDWSRDRILSAAFAGYQNRVP